MVKLGKTAGCVCVRVCMRVYIHVCRGQKCALYCTAILLCSEQQATPWVCMKKGVTAVYFMAVNHQVIKQTPDLRGRRQVAPGCWAEDQPLSTPAKMVQRAPCHLNLQEKKILYQLNAKTPVQFVLPDYYVILKSRK